LLTTIFSFLTPGNSRFFFKSHFSQFLDLISCLSFDEALKPVSLEFASKFWPLVPDNGVDAFISSALFENLLRRGFLEQAKNSAILAYLNDFVTFVKSKFPIIHSQHRLLDKVFGDALLQNIKHRTDLYLKFCRMLMRASPLACVRFDDGKYVRQLWQLVDSGRWVSAPLKTLAVFNTNYPKAEKRRSWLRGDPLEKLCEFWREHQAEALIGRDDQYAWKFVGSLAALSDSWARTMFATLAEASMSDCYPEARAKCVAAVYRAVLRRSVEPADRIVIALSRQFQLTVDRANERVIIIFYEIWAEITERSWEKGTFLSDLGQLLAKKPSLAVYDVRILKLTGVHKSNSLINWRDRAMETILSEFQQWESLQTKDVSKWTKIVGELRRRVEFLLFVNNETQLPKVRFRIPQDQATRLVSLLTSSGMEQEEGLVDLFTPE
jgi:hypothetical protein